MTIVSGDSLDSMVLAGNATAMHAIGRALVLLFQRQTDPEQRDKTTKMHNLRGFTPADAKQGSLGALYYLKHRRLEAWQIEQWTKINRKGRTRIGKYHRQLDEEAVKKARKIQEA
jgi:hypothetical protein